MTTLPLCLIQLEDWLQGTLVKTLKVCERLSLDMSTVKLAETDAPGKLIMSGAVVYVANRDQNDYIHKHYIVLWLILNCMHL